MALVEIDVSELDRMLIGVRARIENADGAAVAEILIEGIDRVLQSEGSWGSGESWDPLSPAYLKARPERRGGQMLQDTELLMGIQPRVGSGWAEGWSPAEYAVYHASPEPRSVMPLRDFLAVDEDWLAEEVGNMLLDDAERGL